MSHIAFRRQLITSLSEPIRSSVTPRACPGPRASQNIERLRPVPHFLQRGGTVWCAATERKVASDISHSTPVVHAPRNHPCALLDVLRHTTPSNAIHCIMLYLPYLFSCMHHADQLAQTAPSLNMHRCGHAISASHVHTIRKLSFWVWLIWSHVHYY